MPREMGQIEQKHAIGGKKHVEDLQTETGHETIWYSCIISMISI